MCSMKWNTSKHSKLIYLEEKLDANITSKSFEIVKSVINRYLRGRNILRWHWLPSKKSLSQFIYGVHTGCSVIRDAYKSLKQVKDIWTGVNFLEVLCCHFLECHSYCRKGIPCFPSRLLAFPIKLGGCITTCESMECQQCNTLVHSKRITDMIDTQLIVIFPCTKCNIQAYTFICLLKNVWKRPISIITTLVSTVWIRICLSPFRRALPTWTHILVSAS